MQNEDVNTLSFQDNLQVEDREVNHHGNAVKVGYKLMVVVNGALV